MGYRDEDGEWVEDEHETGLKNAGDMLRGMSDADAKSGTVPIFGYNLKVPPLLAQFIQPVYRQFINSVARNGSRVAYKYGYDLPSKLGISNPVAYKVARTAEFLWGYGPTLADAGLNVRRSISAGYKETHEVRKLLAPYLAANHNMHASVTALMSDSNHGVQNVRSYIMKKSKNSLKSNFASFAAKIPDLMLVHWSQKLDNINHPECARDAYEAGDSASIDKRVAHLEGLKKPRAGAENTLLGRLDGMFSAAEKTDDYKDYANRTSDPSGAKYMYAQQPWKVFKEIGKIGNPKDLARQVFTPKHANELEMNLKMFGYIPAVGGFIEQWLREKMVKHDTRTLEDFAVIRTAMLADRLKKDPIDDHRELSEEISGLFKLHFKNCGNDKDISQGNCKKLAKVCEGLSEAIIDHGLNPYALIDLVCGDKLVKYNRSGFVFTSTHDRSSVIQKEQAKYTAKVDNKEFYKDVGVKPADLGKIYAALGPEERGFFVMLFPPGILEEQGIDKAELSKIRKANRDEFIDTLAQVLVSVKDMSSEDLKQKYGMSADAAKALLSVAEDFAESSQYGGREANSYLAKHQREAAKAVAKAGLASKPDFWRTLVHKKQGQGQGQEDDEAGEKETSPRLSASKRTPMDHAERDSGDEMGEEAGMPSR